MAEVISPQVDLILDSPVAPTQPDGSTLLASYAFDNYFSLPDGLPVNTTEVKMISATKLGFDDFYRMAMAANQASLDRYNQGEGLPEEVLLFYAYEEQIGEVTIPNQLCVGQLCYDVPAQICVPLTNLCFGVGGQTLSFAYRYTFWYLSQEVAVPPGGPAYTMLARPFLWLPASAWLLIIGILTIAGVTAIILYSVKHGTTTSQSTKPVVTQPGNPSGTVITKPGSNLPPSAYPPSGPPSIPVGPQPPGGVPPATPAEAVSGSVILALIGGVVTAGAVAWAVTASRQGG